MRAVIVLSAACSSMLWTTLAAGQQFPYTLTLPAATSVFGTSESGGLPTGSLAAGTTVEVHRQDGAWLAIRPPAGSFSWVSKLDVEATAQSNTLRVRSEQATCWIGHAGSQQRTTSQVSLRRGELLQVLGDSLIGNEHEIQQW